MQARMRTFTRVLTFLVLLSAGTICELARANSETVETGRLLAVLLDSGRVTIGLNQTLINDPDKGDKSFTAEVFEKQVMALFQERAGVDLADLQNANVPETARPLLARLLEESKKTVRSYQTAINIKGLRYKGLIPATFGTETASRFQRWSGVYLKQTAPPGLLRNLKNMPDEYEAAIMQKFADPSYPRKEETIVSEAVDDGTHVRVMLPLFYRKACLGCHGEPQGERDISGYAKEGGKEGDFGGAISVKLSALDSK